MTGNKKTEKSNLRDGSVDFIKSLREFALTVDEECPEGHRKDPRSGACLPMGSTDHTAFTRSVNNEYGPEWRGLKDKTNETFDDEKNISDRATEYALLNAFDMDAPVSCGEGTTFSFVQRKCISLEAAEQEDAGTGIEIDDTETAKELNGKGRKALPDSSFGVPGKRKFPLHDCNHVRNAMSRFNQAKGLSPAEKAALRRKIMAKASACGIKVDSFSKANTAEEFKEVNTELLALEKRVLEAYASKNNKTGPCPPGMEWSSTNRRCSKMSGFVASILEKADHSDVIALDPAGRKDPIGFKCPTNYIFNFGLRKCIPLDPSAKEGTQPGDTTKASNDQRVLVPSPPGRPAKLPEDCPEGTIWMKSREVCIPLDTEDKIKSSEAADANPSNREGLVPPPPGKVKLPEDCPKDHIWDGNRRTCTPLNPQDKVRQGNPGPYDPKDLAAYVERMTSAQLIAHLDQIIRQELSSRKEKSKVEAKELPNEAFPPSLVSSTRRSLMHHTAAVSDAYDNQTVDVSRLRNALARVSKLEGYSKNAVVDAERHLIQHAQEIVRNFLGKN